MYLGDLILQIPGLAPAYTKHPIFPDLFSAMIIAALISIGLNFAFAMLRKKTTDIDRLSKVMKETNQWRKEYTDAIRKQDKVRISELKKKQAYMLWILVFPSIFGQTVALSPLHIPYIMCTDENVKKDTILDENGQPKGVCNIPGEVFLWGWFLITSLGTSGIIAKITKTSMPSMT
jgi:uncharacterized membrane protein (DUF106 family)